MTTKPISTTTTNAAAEDMVKVTCKLCGYEWETKSDKVMVTCPSCIRKTPIKKEAKA